MRPHPIDTVRNPRTGYASHYLENPYRVIQPQQLKLRGLPHLINFPINHFIVINILGVEFYPEDLLYRATF